MNDVFLPAGGFSTFEATDRVLVGLSGGVDSAVCVNVLRQQGFEVRGAVIRFSPAHDKAVEEAKKAAAALGVPLTVIDAGAAFEKEVVQPFCAAYCAGRTPNPCVLCNPGVKFRLLAAEADKLGCRYIATGHYARVEDRGDGIYTVCRAVSAARDQSYMLYRLRQDILSRLCLPLGEFEKEDVRAMAREASLPCADSPDSMEICFIPDGDYAAFIEGRGLAGKAGRFIGPDGADLGPHKGVLRYTLGQRKGLGLGGMHGEEGRWFVVKKDVADNILYVSHGDEGPLYSRACTARELNFIGFEPPEGEFECTAKFRYRQPEQAVRVKVEGDEMHITFAERQRAVTEGQYAVLYLGEQCIGGGVITEAEK